MLYNNVNEKIDSMRDIALELQQELTLRVSIPPEMGGDGEFVRADFLVDWLGRKGFDSVERIDVHDSRVSTGLRPNIVASLTGKDTRSCTWIVTHLDTVPAGDQTAWNTPPHTAVEKNGLVYGRGTEDNQQGMISSILALLALRDLKLVPQRTLKLLFVADEEAGSKYGIKHLIKYRPELFRPEDQFIIPDGGALDGSELQIAEKNIYVLKFTTTGRQCHASVPGKGLNAFTAGSQLVLALEELNSRFAEITDPKFDPPVSTFVPTRKEANVSATNVLPGEDQFSLDCRIMPALDFSEVAAEIDRIVAEIERQRGVKIVWEVVNQNTSRPTPADDPLVTRLGQAVESVTAVKTKPVGIGGGTVAGNLRNLGHAAVVWSTSSQTAHMPNEYSPLANLLNDAKVFCEFCLRAE
ncbi:MAG: M20 family metallo-hydrolase [Spirochaetota bacterium]